MRLMFEAADTAGELAADAAAVLKGSAASPLSPDIERRSVAATMSRPLYAFTAMDSWL